MEANELRIGNYVNFGIVKEPIILTGGIDNENTTIQMAEPIPLTEEWFIKFGFEEKVVGFFIKEEFIFDIQYSGYPRKYELILDTNSSFCYRQEIKHVHQLQNLFFALTGEELTIKE